jgi:hypothetical protein
MSARAFLLLSAFLLSACAAQSEAAAIEAPERIHIIGASVSGGFEDGPMFGADQQGDSVTLQHILKLWCGDDVKVTTHAPMEMWNLFRKPEEIGEKEVKMAKRREPDVVMAVDFPFWFAYGYVQGDETEARSALLEKGLAMLDEFDVPVVIGDLPDMTGAERRMLSPRQIPSADVLKKLNERLAGYAKAKANVTLVGLAGVVKQMKDDGAVLPLANGPFRTAPGALQQQDRLHANRLGMALLGYTLQDTLRGLFPDGHALRAQQWTFEQFAEAAGALGELELLQEKAKESVGK